MNRALVMIVCSMFAAQAGCLGGMTARQKATIGIPLLVAGVTMAVAGAASLGGPGEDTDGDGKDEFPDKDLECALGGCLAAQLLIAAGLATAVPGFVLLVQSAAEPAPTPPPAPDLHDEVRQLDIRLLAPLPEMPCDATTLELARLARSAARVGKCELVSRLSSQIRLRDPAYADALAGSRAVARCREPKAGEPEHPPRNQAGVTAP